VSAVLPIRLGSLHPERFELVKWLAFAAMVVDHVDLLLFERSLGWAYGVGRLAFPVFALVFGIGLAYSRDLERVARRLALPAAISQIAWVLGQPGYPFNVLVMFALCAIALRWSWAAPFVLLASVFGEAGPLLPLLVLAGYLAGRTASLWPVLIGGLVWCLAAPSLGAGLAVLLVLASAHYGPATLPRLPGLLAWGYAAHLAVLVALAS